MIMLCGLLVNPKATIASMGILIQTTSLVYVFPSSLSLGVSTRVSNELGANRPAKARISMIVSLFCAVGLGLGAMVFTTLMRHQWGRFFTSDEEILKLTSIALPICGICELGNCPQTTGCGVLRGSARPSIGANINLGSFYLVGMPVAMFLGFVLKMGFSGLWLGLLAAQASCAVLMMFVLLRTDWNEQVRRARDLTIAPSSSSEHSSVIPTFEKNQTSHHADDDKSCYLREIVIGDDERIKSVSSIETEPLMLLSNTSDDEQTSVCELK